MNAEILYTMFHWEGGDTLTDHPNDKGGATKYGIAQKYHPGIDVAKLTQTQAMGIYVEEYWNPMKCADLRSQRLKWKVFDVAVQFGVLRATHILQEAVGVDMDGKIGQVTLSAANAMPEDTVLTRIAFAMERRRAYAVVKDPTQLVFLTGWIRRAQDLGEAIAKYGTQSPS